MLYKLCDVDEYESIGGGDQDQLLKKLWLLNSLEGVRILDLLNVKYLVAPWPFKHKNYRLVKRCKDPLWEEWIYLYRSTSCLPRSFYVPQAKVMSDRKEIFSHLFKPTFNPTREVILEEGVASPGGFWFTSEWFYPGWKAYVNGKEAKIYRQILCFEQCRSHRLMLRSSLFTILCLLDWVRL